jgi:hypothetical protein
MPTRRGLAAQEIPADGVGGLVYTGGSLQLADPKDHGVRYAGMTGIGRNGWARKDGRYELDLDGNTVSPTFNAAAGWPDDRSTGLQQTTANAGPNVAAPLSLILSAKLQPRLSS